MHTVPRNNLRRSHGWIFHTTTHFQILFTILSIKIKLIVIRIVTKIPNPSSDGLVVSFLLRVHPMLTRSGSSPFLTFPTPLPFINFFDPRKAVGGGFSAQSLRRDEVRKGGFLA